MFFDLYQVRQLTQEWMEEYNVRRPHESLGNLTPYEWKMNLLKNCLVTIIQDATKYGRRSK